MGRSLKWHHRHSPVTIYWQSCESPRINNHTFARHAGYSAFYIKSMNRSPFPVNHMKVKLFPCALDLIIIKFNKKQHHLISYKFWAPGTTTCSQIIWPWSLQPTSEWVQLGLYHLESMLEKIAFIYQQGTTCSLSVFTFIICHKSFSALIFCNFYVSDTGIIRELVNTILLSLLKYARHFDIWQVSTWRNLWIFGWYQQ